MDGFDGGGSEEGRFFGGFRFFGFGDLAERSGG